MKTTSTLHLAKQNFKFSSGHFLIFDEKTAERLHGHNYLVSVKFKAAAGTDFGAKGYWVDFSDLKKIIKAEVDLLDEHVLLPELHPDIKKVKNKNNWDIQFRDRFYSLPLNEVVFLPVVNTSVEELSKYLAQEIFKKLKPLGINHLWLKVEETPGQGASFEIEA